MHILLLWTTVLLTAVSVLVLLLFKRVWYPWRCWCRHVPFHISSLPTVCALFESFRRGSCNHRIQSSPLVLCRAVLCCSGLTSQTYSFKTNRESLAIADQSLDIIQAWGEAFLPRRVSCWQSR